MEEDSSSPFPRNYILESKMTEPSKQVSNGKLLEISQLNGMLPDLAVWLRVVTLYVRKDLSIFTSRMAAGQFHQFIFMYHSGFLRLRI